MPDARGHLCITFAVPELRDKFVGFLDRHGLRYLAEAMVVTLPDTHLVEFLTLTRDAGEFNQL
jgi:hypothetical protein